MPERGVDFLMKNWYALFIKTGYESFVEQNIRRLFRSAEIFPFVPRAERIVKLPGMVKKEMQNMFPGYLFIDTDIEGVEFNFMISRAKPFMQELIRVVRYSATFDILIAPEERNLLDILLNDERCLEASKGFIENDRVYVTEGPLIGRESIIRKIDRHKRKAIIEMDILGAMRQVTVALEIVEKI